MINYQTFKYEEVISRRLKFILTFRFKVVQYRNFLSYIFLNQATVPNEILTNKQLIVNK